MFSREAQSWKVARPAREPFLHVTRYPLKLPPSSFPFLPPSGREPIYNQILNRTACATLACLRALPADTLLTATLAFLQTGLYGVFPYGPVLDPDFASDVPSKLVRAGKVANVPFMLVPPPTSFLLYG